MLFNSVPFAGFYLAVVLLYFTAPARWRGGLLLAASYYFYMCWSVRYISVIIAITLIDYLAGLAIEPARGAARRLLLALSIFSNFGLLFAFKYADFFIAGLSPLLRRITPGIAIPQLHWLLPVGISFHTFQAVSYTFDIYRGKVKAERDFWIYALYVAFFPQMIAGPIERPGRLLPQLHAPHKPDSARVAGGLRIALWGLFKKTVVADLAAPAVNTIYAHPRNFPGALLCFATVLFAVQIYCDFSGYSDIAAGTARILGYDLTVNFRQPYFAASTAEFWRRWHISLSTWFRDYLYIPLGGNRVSTFRWCASILAVFLLSGLWHGANSTFLVWGAIHGAYILTGAVTRKPRNAFTAALRLDRLPHLHRALQVLTTAGLVTFAWIFFRAGSLPDALYIATHLFDKRAFVFEDFFRVGVPRFETSLLLLAITVVFLIDYVTLNPGRGFENAWNLRLLRWPVYIAGICSVVFFGIFSGVEFIYFQF